MFELKPLRNMKLMLIKFSQYITNKWVNGMTQKENRSKVQFRRYMYVCFLTFLSYWSKICFITIWIKPAQKVSHIDFALLRCAKVMFIHELRFEINFCEIEAENFKRHALSYWVSIRECLHSDFSATRTRLWVEPCRLSYTTYLYRNRAIFE